MIVAQHAQRAAGDVASALSFLGARYDAAPLFPVDSLRLLLSAGYHRRFAPVAAGGESFADERVRFDALRDALRIVGRGDLSVGRLFEGHVNALLLFGWYGSAEQLAWLDQVLNAGAWFGVWATEPAPGTRLIEGDGPVLSGAKLFASGAGGLDYAVVTAAVEGSERRLIIVPANDAARADTSHWRVRGMRASVSGRYDLDGIETVRLMLLGAAGVYDREPRFTAGAWRFCAVQLGGIEALVQEIRSGMSDAAKGDAVQRARFADAVVAARTAGFWVQEAATRTAAEHLDAIAIARMTRGVVERAGLDVIEAASRILGTRSAFDGERADKIIRDLSLYLRQAGPDYARDQAASVLLDHDCWSEGDLLW
jgi:alkylation response protein AidB-like acyl-CoA dehydrogenase